MRVSALTAPRIKPTTTTVAGGKSLRRPPTVASSKTVKPLLSNKNPQSPATPSKPAQQSPSKAVSPGKSPRLIAPWRHQGKAAEPADYEDIYEFSTFSDEPTTSSRPANKPPGLSIKPPLQSSSVSRRELPSSSKSQSPRRTIQESSSTHGGISPTRRNGNGATSPIRPFSSASSTSPSRLPLTTTAASSSSPSRPLTSPTHPLAQAPPASLSPSRKESSTAVSNRISSPATNRLGSPSARIGSPRAEHSRLKTASSQQQRPGSLLLQSSTAGISGISLTSLASDNIVASVESLNEEENNDGIEDAKTAEVTLPNIVCTSTHRDDSAMVKDLVRKFGQFTFSSRYYWECMNFTNY